MFSNLFCWLLGQPGLETEELRADLTRARADLVRTVRERHHALDEVERLRKLLTDAKEILVEIEERVLDE
jgi:hypothetical protein